MKTQNNTPMVAIGETTFPVIEYRGKRVVTFAIVDQVHQRQEGTTRKRFNDHKDKLIDGDDYYRLSFQEVSSLSEFRTAGFQANSQGLTVLTQTGYLMLVKSFTDDLAWKVQRDLVNRYFQTVPTSTVHQVYLMAKAIWEQEERVHQLERDRTDQQHQIEAIVQHQADMDGNTGYMTALAYCRKEGISAPLSFAQRFGIKASEMCRSLSIRTGQIPDERWGSVNSYPVEVLHECRMAMDGV